MDKMMIEELCCFTYQEHACYTHRVFYNRMQESSTYFFVHNDIPTANRPAILGSITTAVAHNKHALPKLSND